MIKCIACERPMGNIEPEEPEEFRDRVPVPVCDNHLDTIDDLNSCPYCYIKAVENKIDDTINTYEDRETNTQKKIKLLMQLHGLNEIINQIKKCAGEFADITNLKHLENTGEYVKFKDNTVSGPVWFTAASGCAFNKKNNSTDNLMAVRLVTNVFKNFEAIMAALEFLQDQAKVTGEKEKAS